MKSRLNWIDALRGLTMLSVVMVHVLTFSFGVNPGQSALCILRSTFTLPLFFFVSGFFLYRPYQEWDRKRVGNALNVRTIAMVGGTILFSSLYGIVMKEKDPFRWIADGNFDKYWYTFSLFQLFIYYLMVTMIMRRASAKGLLVIGLALVAFNFMMPLFRVFDGYWCEWWINKKTAIYSQFFIFGMIMRSNQDKFMRILDRREVMTIILTGYVATLIAGWTYKDFWTGSIEIFGIWIRDFWARLFGILVVTEIFYHNRNFFDSDSRLVRIWLLIGRRTLDIYFLHYFFLPRMRWMSPYLSKGNTFIPELVSALLAAAAILVIVMGISRLMRRAPGLRRLLGVKPTAQ